MKMGEVARLFLDLDESVVEVFRLMEVEGKAGKRIYGKGDDPDRDPAWNLDGYKRPVLRLVLLPVLIRLAYPAADYIQIPNEIAIGINRC